MGICAVQSEGVEEKTKIREARLVRSAAATGKKMSMDVG